MKTLRLSQLASLLWLAACVTTYGPDDPPEDPPREVTTCNPAIEPCYDPECTDPGDYKCLPPDG